MGNHDGRNVGTNNKASASLILGILSILMVLFAYAALILGITGLIFGVIGWQETKKLNQPGKKLAIMGIICSIFGILLLILLTVIGYMAYMNIAFS